MMHFFIGVSVGLVIGMVLAAVLAKAEPAPSERGAVDRTRLMAVDDALGAEAESSHPCARGDDDPACALRGAS